MKSAQRVAFNTAILYLRMVLTVLISLYSTRLVLNALGVTDFGIFNLVAGVIALLSFLNNAMATSTQRYLSYYQGANDGDKVKVVFRNSLLLHILIGIVLVVLLELAGLVLFDYVLKIKPDRLEAAKSIYHFMSATVFFTIITVPFTASLIAHENMLWVAIVNIFETILKLLIALSLVWIGNDRLITYGFLTAAISIISFILYATYCWRTYPECTLSISDKLDKPLIKELTSFAGWNLFGSLCYMGRTQGLAIVLNVFYGTIVNAAYGIANQVSSQLNFFSSTLLRAINPQIMKSEGAGDRQRMLRLSMMASKFGFIFLAAFVIPLIFEMDFVLAIWLRSVPAYTVSFCSYMLIYILISQLTIGIQSALQATGKVRSYQVVVGCVVLLTPVLSCLLLYNGFDPSSVFICNIFIEVLATALRLFFAKRIASLDLLEYYRNVIVRGLVPIIIACVLCWVVSAYVVLSYRPLITILSSSVAIGLSTYYLGLNRDERTMIDSLLEKWISRFSKTQISNA